jgi:hypothetical protein
VIRPLALALGLLVTGACFTESEPMGQTCPAGTPGCACRPSDECDDLLECRDPGVCVEPSCTPGLAGCFCDDGACGDGLVCNDLGACSPAHSGTGDTGTMSSSGTSGTSSTTASTSSSTTAAETTAAETSTTATSDTTDGTPVLCGACLQGDAQDTCYEQAMCDTACMDAGACVAMCKALGNNLRMCGTMCCDNTNKMVTEFFTCMQAACPMCNLPAACIER